MSRFFGASFRWRGDESRINREAVIKEGNREADGATRKRMGKLRESWKVYPAGFDQLLRLGQGQFYVTEGAIYGHDYDRHARRWET